MRKFLLFLTLTMLGFANGADAGVRIGKEIFDDWLKKQRLVSERKILKNISPPGTRRGAVVASPSKHDPNYFYHWVRDAALVMDVWMRQLEGYTPLLRNTELEKLMWDFLDFTGYSQSTPAYVGVGEPRYNVDGTANLDPWGRPQNDGPALRASLFIRFSRYLISTGREGLVREKVWPVIQRDLDYVGEQIYAPSFDLWEEVKGDHFYTRVTARAALFSGSEMARDVGFYAKAAWLSSQAAVAESLAFSHFDESREQIVENMNRQDGIDYKWSGLDVATVLALLHTRQKPLVNLTDVLVMQTAEKIERMFHSIYNINKNLDHLGTAIGRYPEDHYYGGNPWFLATLAFAEYFYLVGNLDEGDRYMRRVRYHVDGDGRMDEQISRENGYMLSAHDLTWSYAAFLTAYEARQRLLSSKIK